MTSPSPFGIGSMHTFADIYRQSRTNLGLAHNTIDHGASIKRLLDQAQGTAGVLQNLQRDPFRDSFAAMMRRMRDDDGLRSTMRAVEEAQRQRDLALRGFGGIDVLDQRRHAIVAIDAGVLRTAEIMARSHGTLAAAIAATRAQGEIAGLAASIGQRIDVLQLAGIGRTEFPKSLAERFAKELAVARKTADLFASAETEEERAALLSRLLEAILSLLRRVAGNTKKEVLGLGLFVLLGIVADVNSLIPHEPPPGMTHAQAQVLEETHRTTEALRNQLAQLAEQDRRLDEAYVSNLPRAELARPATIRTEPRREGKAVWRAPAGTTLAIAQVRGRWRLAIYRDPLTDTLGQGWIYGSAITLLDDM